MSSDICLDIDPLLLAVPGDDPAGDAKAYVYGIREQLEELRREEDPDDFDDATRPAQLKKADWPAVVKLAEEALTGQTKDLRIVCHLIEGLTRVDGFAGLRDGLVLLRRLLEEAWDRLVPDIDDGDLDNRAAPLANMLDDAERGIRFPNTIRSIPLFGRSDDGYGLTRSNRLRTSSETADQDEFSQTVAATSAEQLQTLADAIAESLAALQQLLPVLENRLESTAPGMLNLGAAITECQKLVAQELSQRVPVAPSPEEGNEEQTNAGGEQSGSAQQTIATRAEAYQQLNRAAELLAQIEPHSPIPYLVKRAVKLGRLPFPRLIEQLIRDDGVLTELNREMGIANSAVEEPVET